MVFVFASALIGFALGLRFRALILVPATFVAIVTTGGFGIARGFGTGETLGAMVLAAVAVQLGYAVASIRFGRAERRPPVAKERPLPTALSGSAQ
jgi:hypothetical protein